MFIPPQLSQNRSNIYTGTDFECPDVTECDPLNEDDCTSCVQVVQVETSPDNPSTDPREDIRLRSVCPWTYVQTTNKIMRYPPVIVEAQCSCPKSGSCPCFGASSDSSCEPVDMPIPILVNTRQADSQGRCIFTPQMYRLKIGCTCAKKPVVY